MRLTEQEQIKIHKDFSKGRLEICYDENDCTITVDSAGYDIMAICHLSYPLEEIEGTLDKGDYLTPDYVVGSKSIDEQIEDIIICKIHEFEKVEP